MSTIPGFRELGLSEGGTSCHSNYGKGVCIVKGLGSALVDTGTQCLLCEMTPKRTQCVTKAKKRDRVVSRQLRVSVTLLPMGQDSE